VCVASAQNWVCGSSVTNACIIIAKYLYIYIACDIILLPLYYRVWLTLCGRLAFRLSLNLQATLSLQAQPLHDLFKSALAWRVNLTLSAYSLNSLEQEFCHA